MRNPVPIYKDHDDSFAADGCLPLVEAVGRKEIHLQALVHGHYPGQRLPGGELTGLKTVGHWDAKGVQSWGLPCHRNEGIEVTFLESGRLGFGVDDREYTLQPDALTVTRPWQTHRVGDPVVTAGKLHWLILDVGVRRPNQPWKWPPWIMLSERDRAELAGILRQTDQPVWKTSSEIRHCFHGIAGAVESDRKGSNISVLTIRINELFLLLLTLLRKQKLRLNESLTSSQSTVELFLDDLRQHPQHLSLEWTVGEMAASCGLGVTQFVHVVKQLTNMPPLHFLNHCRLEVAKQLLRGNSAESVTTIAQTCGFSSSQYFATVFARQFGCSPTTYRKRHEAALEQSAMGRRRHAAEG